MDLIVTRAIAGAGLVLSLGIGGWTASRLTLDTGAAVETAMAKRISPEQAQRRALAAETSSYETSEAFFQTRIDEAVSNHGVANPGIERLLAPNTFFHVASPGDTRTVAPGAGLREAGIALRIRTETIEVERRGIRTKTEHTLAELENVGTAPLAYFVNLRVAAGDCEVRAVTRFNAMALLPGEKAEMSICAGKHEVEIRDLRVMEVSELGALWVSKVPALAVGHDTVVARSHFAGPGIEMCAELPSVDYANLLESGEAAWEDIVDFYSRHDCEHYRWWPEYERIVEPLPGLPALPK